MEEPPLQQFYISERFQNSCTHLAAVFEPSGGVFCSDGFQCLGYGLVEGISGACLGSVSARRRILAPIGAGRIVAIS